MPSNRPAKKIEVKLKNGGREAFDVYDESAHAAIDQINAILGDVETLLNTLNGENI